MVNQKTQKNLDDVITSDWELQCPEKFLFYRLKNATGSLVTRALWFDDDQEKAKVLKAIKQIMRELAPSEPQTENDHSNDRLNPSHVDGAYVDATAGYDDRIAALIKTIVKKG